MLMTRRSRTVWLVVVLAACSTTTNNVDRAASTAPTSTTRSIALPSAQPDEAPFDSSPRTSTASTTAAAPTTTAASATTGASTTTGDVAPVVEREGLFNFTTPPSIDEWRTQNDPVMGGESSSEVRWVNGALSFTGTISLANGGGFASLLSPEFFAADALGPTTDAMTIDASGDGHTYVVQLRTTGQSIGWVARFSPPSQRTTTTLSWSQFEPADRFLNPISSDQTFDPAQVDALAIYILDKQEGDFALSIFAIS
jgi:hypothetical protein